MRRTSATDAAAPSGAGDVSTLRRVLAGWAEYESVRALHPADRDAIASTEAVRWLIADLFGTAPVARDLFNACARLGALMAEAGASPSLAAGSIDSAVRAMTDARFGFDAARVLGAQASLVEGYVGAVRDAEREAGRRSWEYPACAVHLEDGSVAIACGYPETDPEALGDWAARIAHRLVREGIRKARLAGAPAAKAEVASALDLVGIEAIDGTVKATDTRDTPRAPQRSWLRLPWRK